MSFHLGRRFPFIGNRRCTLRAHLSVVRSNSTQVAPITMSDANKEKIEQILQGLEQKNRSHLARAITLVESSKPEHREMVEVILSRILKVKKDSNVSTHTSSRSPKTYTKSSFRIAFSGPPGAGKSSFIEALGKYLTGKNHRVAVLAVDPSSQRTGGSILGDKTRMFELSRDENAFVRPSPSRCALGGVCRSTSESVLLCEAAGYDVILIETVGVGQSETLVANMVDIFTLILPPGGGDDLQGIKRGIVEISDLILINKSDGDLLPASRRARADIQAALKLLVPLSKDWTPKVLQVSAREGSGLDRVYDKLWLYRKIMSENGQIEKKRKSQRKTHLWSNLTDMLLRNLQNNSNVKESLHDTEKKVVSGDITPGKGADNLLHVYLQSFVNNK